MYKQIAVLRSHFLDKKKKNLKDKNKQKYIWRPLQNKV